MKKTSLGLLVFVLLLGMGAYFYYEKYGAPQAPTFVKLTKVKLSDAKLPPNMSVIFNAEAHLRNPNPFSVTISGMDFDVFVNGKKASHVNQDLDSKMTANSDFMLPLRFEVPLKEKELFKGLGDLLKGAWKKKAIDIRSDGTISVKALDYSLGIPFEHEDTYRLSDF